MNIFKQEPYPGTPEEWKQGNSNQSEKHENI